MEFKKKCEDEYNAAYDIADKYVKKHNWCNIREENGVILCNNLNYSGKKGLCCEGCSHLGDKGCTVKSLGCKVGYCEFGKDPNDCGIAKFTDQEFDEYIKMREDSRNCFTNKELFHGHLLRMSFEQTFKYCTEPILVKRTLEHFDEVTGKFIDE